MAGPVKETWRRISRAVVPARLLRHQIAWRNWRRGEPEIRLLSSLVPPGRAALDVGAFLGAYTYFLVRLASRVVAVEPQADCAAFLRRAYDARVQVLECALSDYDGAGALSGRAGQAVRLAPADAASGAAVRVCRLDGLDLGDFGFIKIDAEGAERAVLRGAAQTIARSRPVLLIEIEERHIDAPIETVFDAIAAMGYRGEFLLDGVLRPLASFDVEALQRARLAGDRSRPYINNFVFRPVPAGG